MKLARAKEEEIDRLFNILNEVEQLAKEMNRGYGIEDIDFSEYEILSNYNKESDEDFLRGLVTDLSRIHFQRILFNLTTLLENCVDLELPHLDFNKDIKAGLELLEKSKSENQ